jgi:peptide/nickel transport system substrate-binding protein
VPPGTGAWHDSSIKPRQVDRSKANQILDTLGYTVGSGGIRTAGGHPMSYTVIFPHDEQGAGDRAFQIIQSDFQKIGVKLIQKPMDDSAAFDAIGAPSFKYLNFDLAMWDWVPLEDPDFILSVMQCNQYGAWSDSGYCNPAYDQLYLQQSTATNPKDRQQIVYQMQKKIYDDRPYIVINYQDIIDAWTKSWDGFVESNQGLFNPLSKESMVSVHQV